MRVDREVPWLGWLFAVVLALMASVSPHHPSPQHSARPQSAPPQSAPPPTRPAALAPAASKYPAAGICLPPQGRLAVIRVNPDTTDPRCAEVTATQRLRVVNLSNRFGQPGQAITIRFANFPRRVLAVGNGATYDRQFGDYLARGDHFLHLSLYGGGGADICLCQGISR